MNVIKNIRKKYKLSQSEFANLLNVHQTAVSQWENNRTKPDINIAKAISQKFNISLDIILDNTLSNAKSFSYNASGILKIPVYGSIPAGIPMEAIEDILGYEEVPEDWARGGREFFALKINGDSMEPEYRSGDIVIFLRQSDCENNEDCAVSINGNDWTFKRVEKLEGGVLIKPLNPNYDTQFYTAQQCQELPVEVKGVFWELRRSKR